MQATLSPSSRRLVVPGLWSSGLLLAVTLANLAVSLSAADWTDGLGLLTPVVLGGFLLGLAMSFSRWNGLFPVLHSLITGTVWVLLWVSRAPQIPDELLGSARVAFIGQSLWNWIMLLFTEQPARSNLVFVLELSLLLWWLGYLAAWAVFREGRVWRAIVPVGLVMLVNLYYGPSSLRFYLAVFIVCALLLAVRSHLAEQELVWRHFRVRYANDIQFDFLRDGFLFAILVMVLALFAPNAATSGVLSPLLDPLRQPWEQVQEEWGRLFSSLNYQASGLRPTFGNTLTLGGPRNLGDTVIMDVRASAGRYWRAAAYDTYTGGRWINTSKLAQTVDFGSHVRTPTFAARREVTQTITTYYPAGGILFGAPQPVRISLKAQADLGVIRPGEAGEPPLAEVTMLRRSGQVLKPGETYLVVSSLTTAHIEDLREANTDYPEWIKEKYLQVPDTVPPRVAELAERVTAYADTPYDKAVALEQFLRGYRYDDQIAAPPPGVDAVDYFLFDVRAGYCDYYATAFAIMARTLGIPARVSAGYNQGEYIAEVGAYRVREYNGHSWPEVFFPGYGWVEFEPTASEEEIVRTHRPERNEQLSTTPTPTIEDGEDENRFGNEPELGSQNPPPSGGLGGGSGWLIGIGGMFLMVGAAAFLLLRPSAQRGRRALLDPKLPARLYGRLVTWADRLGVPLLLSQTPNEHAAVLAGAVPEGRPAIYSIAGLYVHEQYSPYALDEQDTKKAMTAWITLQPMLRRRWLSRKLGPLGRLFRRSRSSRPDLTGRQ